MQYMIDILSQCNTLDCTAVRQPAAFVEAPCNPSEWTRTGGMRKLN